MRHRDTETQRKTQRRAQWDDHRDIHSVALSVPLCLCVAFVFSVNATANGQGRFVDLGPQITSSLVIGTTFTKDPSGHDLVCTVMRGHPAKLIVFDVRGGQMLHRMPLAGANGAWNACTASDGSVYVGSDANGHLYRWIPGEDEAHNLGQVAPDQTFAWDVCAGREGEVFVGTYPGCLVI